MEYVREEPSFGFGLPATLGRPPTRTDSTEVNVGSPPPKPRRKYVRKIKELEDDETRRKRDILASVACLENIEEYVGEKIKPIEFHNMTKERLEALFDLYQQKAGQELATDGMKAAINVFTRALNYFGVEFEDQCELEQELLENRFLKRTIGRQSSKISEQYGDLVGVLNAVADVYKHVSIGGSEVQAEALEGASMTPKASSEEQKNESLE